MTKCAHHTPRLPRSIWFNAEIRNCLLSDIFLLSRAKLFERVLFSNKGRKQTTNKRLSLFSWNFHRRLFRYHCACPTFSYFKPSFFLRRCSLWATCCLCLCLCLCQQCFLRRFLLLLLHGSLCCTWCRNWVLFLSPLSSVQFNLRITLAGFYFPQPPHFHQRALLDRSSQCWNWWCLLILWTLNFMIIHDQCLEVNQYFFKYFPSFFFVEQHCSSTVYHDHDSSFN